MGMVRREMGDRTLAAYLLGISLASLGLGTDAVVARYGIDIPAQLVEGTELIPVWLAGVSAILPATQVLAGGPRRRRAIAAPAQA
jgi:TctA family transporter